MNDWKNKNASNPLSYYLRTGLIGLYPTPDTASTAGLKMYYISKPNVLANETDEAFSANPALEPYHPLIVTYALWKAKQKRGQFSQGEAYKKEYYEGLQIMLREVHFEPDYQQVIRPYYQGVAKKSPHADPLQQT